MKKRFQLFLSSIWPMICFKSKFINDTIFENGSSSQSMIKLCHHFYTEFVSTAQSIIYYCGIDVQFSRRWRPQIPKDTQNRPFSQKSGARVFSFKQSLVQDLNQWLILLLCHLVFNFLRNDGHRFQKTPQNGLFSQKTGVPVLTFYTEFVSTAQSIIYYCGIDVQFSRRWRP